MKEQCSLKYYRHNKHQQYLIQLPKIPQTVADITTLYSPSAFYTALMQAIKNARYRIYLTALYLEQDQGGQKILEALYKAKTNNFTLETAILVDWHRAHRGRIGVVTSNTNADWYLHMARIYSGIDNPIYGVPINTREALGVFHLKGFIIDSQVIYSGASLNNAYLHQQDKYRYDRYQIIRSQMLADTMFDYIKHYLLTSPAVKQLNKVIGIKKFKLKNNIRSFRLTLKKANYFYHGRIENNKLSIAPIVGLGKKSMLNRTIHHLLRSTRKTLAFCTPYFNLPTILIHDLIYLLHLGRTIEIIVGDKTANDFYIPEDQPFKIIGTLPYLYEINLRKFITHLQCYIDTGQLIVRLWKNNNNSYHLKGIWVDQEWQLLTGNNLNLRAWRLDLENALLVYDPMQDLFYQKESELNFIRTHTRIVQHFNEIQSITDYPIKVRSFIRRIRRVHIDRLIARIT